jgi:hypothetical protein
MADSRPLTNEDGEVRELTANDLDQFVPFAALPNELRQLLTSDKRVTRDPIPSATQEPAA